MHYYQIPLYTMWTDIDYMDGVCRYIVWPYIPISVHMYTIMCVVCMLPVYVCMYIYYYSICACVVQGFYTGPK